MAARNDLFQQLIEEIMVIKGRLHDRSTAHDGVPYGQKAALFCISNCQAVNVKELARVLGITSGAVTQHVEALVQEGLVVRDTDPKDRRNVIVKLSVDGAKKIKQLECERQVIMEELFARINDVELETLVTIVRKLSSEYEIKKG